GTASRPAGGLHRTLTRAPAGTAVRSGRGALARPGVGGAGEQGVASKELAKLVEGAVDALPAAYRAVFVLRDVEGRSTAETAASLDIPEQTAKTRLHRARTLLRNYLSSQAHAALPWTFQFAGARCDRIVARS